MDGDMYREAIREMNEEDGGVVSKIIRVTGCCECQYCINVYNGNDSNCSMLKLMNVRRYVDTKTRADNCPLEDE